MACKDDVHALDAVKAKVAQWRELNSVGSASSDAFRTCIAIGERVAQRVNTSLMKGRFPASWIEPILEQVEDSGKYIAVKNFDQVDKDYAVTQAAEIAALRLETLQFETLMRELNKRMTKAGL